MSDTPLPLNLVKVRKRRTALIPTNHGGSHRVMTPPDMAARIVAHFKPTGNLLDPCRGEGAFFNAFPASEFREWCEVDERRNFFTFDFGDRHYHWLITNPPWDQIRPFTDRAMTMRIDNIVWLALINSVFMTARLRDMDEAGYGIKEIVRIEHPSGPSWPKCGMALGAIHIAKGYSGPIAFGRLS